jgi:DNA-binding PadR family transcriptional regulator
MKILSRADELVLLTVWRLQDNAYGVPIRKHIIELTGVEWSVGAIYDSLERLTTWNYLEAMQSEPMPERGGRSRRYFQLKKAGFEALAHLKKVQELLWLNLPDPGFKYSPGEYHEK